jgi:hypothetical protein
MHVDGGSSYRPKQRWVGPAPTGLGDGDAERSLHSCMEVWTDWMDVLSEVGGVGEWKEELSEVHAGGTDDCRKRVGDAGGGRELREGERVRACGW